jgi:hypothetical protein
LFFFRLKPVGIYLSIAFTINFDKQLLLICIILIFFVHLFSSFLRFSSMQQVSVRSTINLCIQTKRTRLDHFWEKNISVIYHKLEIKIVNVFFIPFDIIYSVINRFCVASNLIHCRNICIIFKFLDFDAYILVAISR